MYWPAASRKIGWPRDEPRFAAHPVGANRRRRDLGANPASRLANKFAPIKHQLCH